MRVGAAGRRGGGGLRAGVMDSGYAGGYGEYAGAEAGLFVAKEFRLSRITYLCIALAQQVLAGGVIFGWQALLPVLYDYGVFAESCKGGKADPTYPCLKMRSKLALVFSIAGSASAVGGLVAGLIMDYCGTRVARMFSASMVLAGALMLAYATPESIMWFPGLALMGFGGNGIQITTFHISNLFQGNEKLVVSMIAGAFAASSSLFTFMRLLHETMHWDMHAQFLGYAGICGMVLMTSSVWPDKPFTSPDDLEQYETQSPMHARTSSFVDMSCHSFSEISGTSRDSSMHGGVEVRDSGLHALHGLEWNSDDVFEPLMGDLGIIPENVAQISNDNHLCLDLSSLPLRQQLMTPEWMGLLLFFNVQLLTSTFFLTAVGDQLQCVVCGCGGKCWDSTCLHECTAEGVQEGNQWLMAFGIIYPLGFITTPLCGYLQDRYQMSGVFVFVNATFFVWQAAAMVPNIQVQAAGLVCFSSSRQFLFSFFFAAVGSTFGYENFGFLTGLANAVSAGVLMLNAPLYEVTASRFGALYVSFLGATMVFFVVAYWFRRRFQRLRQQPDDDWDTADPSYHTHNSSENQNTSKSIN